MQIKCEPSLNVEQNRVDFVIETENGYKEAHFITLQLFKDFYEDRCDLTSLMESRKMEIKSKGGGFAD